MPSSNWINWNSFYILWFGMGGLKKDNYIFRSIPDDFIFLKYFLLKSCHILSMQNVSQEMYSCQDITEQLH